MGIFDQFGIFPDFNVRVTHSAANEPRSESSIVVDPANPQRLLGASKRFTDPHAYKFRLAPVFSDDGGNTWKDLPGFPLVANHDVYTDPSTTFDTAGKAWVMGDPGFFSKQHPALFQQLNCSGADPDAEDIQTTHLLAFSSTTNGASWSQPIAIVPQRCIGDDKGWIACDNTIGGNPVSPYHGRMYAVWGAETPFRFARSLDGGATWKGVGAAAAGANATTEICFAPDISISRDGTIHVFWHEPHGSTIKYLRSTDGGESFLGTGMNNNLPVATNVVTGLVDISSGIPTTSGGWPVFEGATFRVLTIVSACCFGDTGVMVAWADARSGQSRTYYRLSLDQGLTWQGPASGIELLPQLSGNSHQFHPQLATTGTGVIGCAMYSYAKDARAGHLPGVSVLVAASFDKAATWDFKPITDQPWDPAINAPWSHGDSQATFIGDYFGFDAGLEEFHVLWTDTRDGNQELYYCQVATRRQQRPSSLGDQIVATLLTPGTARDGGGWIVVNGHLIHVGPRDPLVSVLQALVAAQTVANIPGAEARHARAALLDVVIASAAAAKKQIQAGHAG